MEAYQNIMNMSYLPQSFDIFVLSLCCFIMWTEEGRVFVSVRTLQVQITRHWCVQIGVTKGGEPSESHQSKGQLSWATLNEMTLCAGSVESSQIEPCLAPSNNLNPLILKNLVVPLYILRDMQGGSFFFLEGGGKVDQSSEWALENYGALTLIRPRLANFCLAWTEFSNCLAWTEFSNCLAWTQFSKRLCDHSFCT